MRPSFLSPVRLVTSIHLFGMQAWYQGEKQKKFASLVMSKKHNFLKEPSWLARKTASCVGGTEMVNANFNQNQTIKRT